MSKKKESETNEILNRLKEALAACQIKKHGMVKEVAENTGYSYPQASALLSGKANLNDRFISTICTRYMISEEWLRGGRGEMFNIPVPYTYGTDKDADKQIDECRRWADEQDGIAVKGVALAEIPVLGRISAGFPNVAAEEVIEYISIPGTPENSFALIISGNSMAPTIKDGDYVLFIENGVYRSGDVLVVLDEWGDAMVKRLKVRDSTNFLISDNSEYPIIEPNEHYRIIGKVVKVWRDVKF